MGAECAEAVAWGCRRQSHKRGHSEIPAALPRWSFEPGAGWSLGSCSFLPERLLSAERRLEGLLLWAHWPKQGFKNREASHRDADCCLLLNNQKLECSGPQSSDGRTGQGPPYGGAGPWGSAHPACHLGLGPEQTSSLYVFMYRVWQCHLQSVMCRNIARFHTALPQNYLLLLIFSPTFSFEKFLFLKNLRKYSENLYTFPLR